MKDESPNFIPIPDKMDYRTTDFYDLNEDIFEEQCTDLYRSFSEMSKRYTDVKEIASGGMKRIYRAYDQKTGRYVALARLHDSVEENSSSFLAEARLTAALQHPNIIKVHDIDYDDSKAPYFTMDLKLGDSLADIIKKLKDGTGGYSKKYPLEALLNIFIKVSDAVSYSHSQGILHLDIKPENVQVGEHGEVLLCDWGLARYTGEMESSSEQLLDNNFLTGQTVMGKVRGTPGYMAPELIIDKRKRSIQTDIYALGAVLYNLLTWCRPFEGDTDEILLKTVHGRLTPPLDRRKDRLIPDSLNAIVLKAMDVEMKYRYQSAAELIADVQKYLYGYSTSAEKAGFIKETALFYKRNKTVCNITFVSISILSFILYAFIMNIEKARKNELSLRLKAEENFAKYKNEKEMADLSLSTDPASVLYKIKEDYHNNFLFAPLKTMNDTMAKLERIKEVNHNDILLYEFKGDMHVIRQEFDLALAELQKGRGQSFNRHLFRALNVVKDYKSNGRPAPVEVIKNFLQTIRGNMAQQHFRMLIYDKEIRNNLAEHIQIVECVIAAVNRLRSLKVFKYDLEKKSLFIEGNIFTLNDYFSSYDRHVSVLSTIEVEHLKLKGMANFKTTSLQGLNLKSLDLSGVHLTRPAQTLTKGITDKLIVSRELVDPQLLKQYQSVTEVIFAEEN